MHFIYFITIKTNSLFYNTFDSQSSSQDESTFDEIPKKSTLQEIAKIVEDIRKSRADAKKNRTDDKISTCQQVLVRTM